ncbi:hypothetical protein HPP92_007907 [Vanilla planifolia]|uniref:Uncharacterized protein n=1 Tax=Vanilla planifolia TaxID=51239 RepID=A0A835RGV9_VANPL|nr:hypothetical protein HPP92_007907 [Vanilla planifolia]
MVLTMSAIFGAPGGDAINGKRNRTRILLNSDDAKNDSVLLHGVCRFLPSGKGPALPSLGWPLTKQQARLGEKHVLR